MEVNSSDSENEKSSVDNTTERKNLEVPDIPLTDQPSDMMYDLNAARIFLAKPGNT